jgi:hypothetical protein
MPVLATLIKVATLVTALTFFGAIKAMPDAIPDRGPDKGATRVASDARPAHLQCRLYFGCAPARN